MLARDGQGQMAKPEKGKGACGVIPCGFGNFPQRAPIGFKKLYNQTPEGLEMVYGICRKREAAVNAAAHELGFPRYGERLLIAAGWTVGLRAFVEET